MCRDFQPVAASQSYTGLDVTSGLDWPEGLENVMSNINNKVDLSNTVSAAETQPPVKLDPEALVEQIRLLRSQMDEVTPLTPAQKRTLRAQSQYQSDAMVAGSLNVLGALDKPLRH